MNYTIKTSIRRPITVVSPNRSTVRVVVYKRVVSLAITDMESNWGIRYGVIKLGGVKRIVKSRILSNGEYSQWELI